ncbi:alanine racemase [Halalkalibacter hemicellulosilyticus]|uniref:Alanine racemase n=1 Tax=Halalkalibacter hemicellulosilyticusJCM 9152 TaxID=1236971 RepID=W4QA57_9BACI|nr:alanine racemase [Halalkalibacter hemicellulosilyticus]GAE28895.1 alanine racemase [Halalkalibacter hemicellulosilyticusJCM 9152]
MSKEFYRDTWAEIDLRAIRHNMKSVCNLYHNRGRDVKVMAVVKANGYGHGAIEVAKAVLESGAAYLAVALLDEAIELREAGIEAPILVMGRIRPEDVTIAIRYRITVTVFQLEWLQEAKLHIGTDQKLFIHIKIDTGMGRIGVRLKSELLPIVSFISKHPNMELEGVFTHFATADEKNTDYYETQQKRFLNVLKWIKELGVHIPLIHSGNSAAGMRFPDHTFNMFRFGISLYGLTPSLEIKEELPIELKPAFTLKSRLTHVKKLPAGEAISYGATYQTETDEWIGTIPIGYADGWIRKNSTNNGEVLVNGERVPLVGRICMDQCMIHLKGAVEVGTVVTLIGHDHNTSISVDEVAQRLETINYEIVCMIGMRVPRVYIN